MFRDEIGREFGLGCIHYARLSLGKTGCVGLAFGRAQMNLREEGRTHVILHIASNDDAHAGSSGSVAEEEDARLERSLECRRREGKNGLLTQAYADSALCAAAFPMRGSNCSDTVDTSD
jgi:hypothetical protein